MLRSALLKLSANKKFGAWVTSNPAPRRMARRFVAGESLEEAIAAARRCNDAGMAASLDYLGENVANTSDAQRSEEHTSELQSAYDLVCRLLLEKKKKNIIDMNKQIAAVKTQYP